MGVLAILMAAFRLIIPIYGDGANDIDDSLALWMKVFNDSSIIIFAAGYVLSIILRVCDVQLAVNNDENRKPPEHAAQPQYRMSEPHWSLYVLIHDEFTGVDQLAEG